MPGQVIGTVNVQVGPTTNPRVNTLNYGNRSLKSANDVDLNGIQENGILAYQANNQIFVATTLNDLHPNLDAGLF